MPGRGYDTALQVLGYNANISSFVVGQFIKIHFGNTSSLNAECYHYAMITGKLTTVGFSQSAGDGTLEFGIYVDGVEVLTFTPSISGEGTEVIDISGDDITVTRGQTVALKTNSGTHTGVSAIQIALED